MIITYHSVSDHYAQLIQVTDLVSEQNPPIATIKRLTTSDNGIFLIKLNCNESWSTFPAKRITETSFCEFMRTITHYGNTTCPLMIHKDKLKFMNK